MQWHSMIAATHWPALFDSQFETTVLLHAQLPTFMIRSKRPVRAILLHGSHTNICAIEVYKLRTIDTNTRSTKHTAVNFLHFLVFFFFLTNPSILAKLRVY